MTHTTIQNSIRIIIIYRYCFVLEKLRDELSRERRGLYFFELSQSWTGRALIPTYKENKTKNKLTGISFVQSSQIAIGKRI